MAATGWTSPTGVWLPVVGAEIRSDKVFVVLRRQATSGHSRWRVLQARTRPLWRRVPVGLRPQRRRRQTGTALPGDGVAGPQLAPANRL